MTGAIADISALVEGEWKERSGRMALPLAFDPAIIRTPRLSEIAT